MKILQVVPYFYPAWAYGGPGKLVYDTSMHFAKSGHQVTVYTGDGYDSALRMPKKFYLNEKNITVHYFHTISNYLAYTYNIYLTPALYIRALTEIKKFDVVHIHDFYTLQNFYIGWLCRIFHIPYIVSVHGCLEEKRLAQRSSFKQFFLWLYGYKLLAHAHQVIATSENEVKAYQQFGVSKKKIALLGHGITMSEFQTKVNKKQALRNLKLPENKVIITFLGRIHKIKGLDRLVETISLLKKEKNLFFVIAGSDDGFLPELNEIIAKCGVTSQVKKLGTCFGEAKAQLFKASDIFMYPSYSEGFSLGILEAAAAGLPLILSTGCHFEEVTTHHAGLVVRNDAQSLKKAIKTLASKSQLRHKYGHNAKQLIENKYSMKKIGNSLLSIYEKYI